MIYAKSNLAERIKAEPDFGLVSWMDDWMVLRPLSLSFPMVIFTNDKSINKFNINQLKYQTKNQANV